MFLFLICNLVFQNGDTIQFLNHGEIVDIMILGDSMGTDSLEPRTVRRGKVSDDHRFFSIHEAVWRNEDEILSSKVSIYSADRKMLWEERAEGPGSVSYELSGVHNELFFVGTWDRFCGNPTFAVIIGGEKIVLIKEGGWEQVVDYEISPNGQYFLFHTRNPYNYRTWDYIYFYDLNTKAAWDYLFPVCVSCKRAKISLAIDNDGRAEVVYKNEHRVFSKLGALEDLFYSPQ